ncbi:MAG: tripartite tricarboxylate transporter TctB family protein [Pseudolabrys sp.]|nr:tripartite tricarboxylate transporter TctB family protein [Pseudolabrys sp.]
MLRRLMEARAVAASLVVVALIFVAGSFAIPIGTLLAPGPGLVPLILGCAMLAAMAASIAVDRLKPLFDEETASGADDTGGQESRAGLPRVPVILAVIGLTVLGFEPVGFVPTIFIGSLTLLYGLERRSLLISLAVSIILSVGLFLLFERVLYISLPRGLMEFWP